MKRTVRTREDMPSVNVMASSGGMDYLYGQTVEMEVGTSSTDDAEYWTDGWVLTEAELYPVDSAKGIIGDMESSSVKIGPLSLNHNEGKPRPTLILSDMQKSFNKLLEVREYGCKKYDRLNWSHSIGTDEAEKFLQDNLDSILRHVLARLGGEEIDGESGCSHAAQAAIRLMFDLEYSNV